MPALAVDLQMAARLLYEAVDLAQTQPGSLPGRLRRKERLDRAIDNIALHSAASIAYGQKHILTRRNVGVVAAVGVIEIGIAGLDGELAAVLHGVAGIDRKID